MAKVRITKRFFQEITKKFPSTVAKEILLLCKSLEEHPKKGKQLTVINDVVLKEIKIKSFRFYFLTDGRVLKFGTADELATLVIKFVRMSDKKSQKKVIAQIKEALKALGFDSFT